MSDERILDFSKDLSEIRIPEMFKQNKEVNVMLTAGDASSYFGRFSSGELNLVSMPPYGWNVFCCLGFDSGYSSQLKENIDYLVSNPGLNILLCLIDLTDMRQCENFGKFFDGKVDKIDSHDKRWYLPTRICFRILKPKGFCYTSDKTWRSMIHLPENEFNFNGSQWNCVNMIGTERDDGSGGRFKCIKDSDSKLMKSPPKVGSRKFMGGKKIKKRQSKKRNTRRR
jgi:hypothetical protein